MQRLSGTTLAVTCCSVNIRRKRCVHRDCHSGRTRSLAGGKTIRTEYTQRGEVWMSGTHSRRYGTAAAPPARGTYASNTTATTPRICFRPFFFLRLWTCFTLWLVYVWIQVWVSQQHITVWYNECVRNTECICHGADNVRLTHEH